MSQRLLAGIVAVPSVLLLWGAALFLPAPYVTYLPGQTTDMLGPDGAAPYVEVAGHEEFVPESGALRMTTARVTRPETQVPLGQAFTAWLDRDAAVYPHDVIYSDDDNDEDDAAASAAMMASSQDVSSAVALSYLGEQVDSYVRVVGIEPGLPAEGLLEVNDVLLAVDGTEVADTNQVADLVRRAGVDAELELTLRRDEREQSVSIRTARDGDRAVIGVSMSNEFDLPFTAQVTPPEGVGGSSAGMMFALTLYDVLTPGDLTGGLDIAGTGTLDFVRTDDDESLMDVVGARTTIGSIGGITQKIPGARDAGSEAFLVPSGNCEEALGAERGDMRIVAVDDFERAVQTVEALAADIDADVLTCEDVVAGVDTR